MSERKPWPEAPSGSVAAVLPTVYGTFVAHHFAGSAGAGHVVLAAGEVRGREDVLVRVHSECITGDLFGSLRCDCGEQLRRALRAIADEGVGLLIYLRGHEGRGIGLPNKLRAYQLQDEGFDTVDANLQLNLPVDGRAYDDAIRILRGFGLASLRLMTNNPVKRERLERGGLRVTQLVPIAVPANPINRRYLLTKKRRLGHLIDVE